MIRSSIIIFIVFLWFQCAVADIDYGRWFDEEGEKTRAKYTTDANVGVAKIINAVSSVATGIWSAIKGAASGAVNIASNLGNITKATWDVAGKTYGKAKDYFDMGRQIHSDLWDLIKNPQYVYSGGVGTNHRTPPRMTWGYHENVFFTDYAPQSRKGPPGFDWNAAGAAQDIMKVRVINWAMIHVERSRRRVASIAAIKRVYENGMPYEMGYVMANIIEKYRLMVEWNQKPMRIKSDEAWDALKATQQIQRLYIEAWHLCMMLHEIPRKYGIKEQFTMDYDFARDQGPSRTARPHVVLAIMEQMKKDAIKKRKEKKNRLKEFMKIRHDYLAYVNASVSTEINSLRPWWPIEYGWEIDYKW